MASKKLPFKPVEANPDFVQMEKLLLRKWYKSGLVRKYLQRNKNSKKHFSFLDGPITANNPMGVHHAWGRTYKDIWQRWYNMRGFKQRFQNGFDAQGLWVEVEVEKELGLKSKRDIENLVSGDKKKSIAKFVELCKKRVFKYAKVQTEQSKRLGYFMDWENSYYTLSDENNYMIWHFLKKCHESGLIYKGRDAVAWCPRCGTAISQHEILTEDYKETTHDSVYVKYPVKGKDFSLLVWTTTPWTLPGNVAVAVERGANYEVWEWRGQKVLVQEEAWGRLRDVLKEKYGNLEEFKGSQTQRHLKGSDIVGLEYDSPFENLPRVKETLGDFSHKVVATDSLILPISGDEGTGLVHVAPGAGSEDFQLGRKLGLPVIELIDEEANYISDLGNLSGKNAKQHPEVIINFLEKEMGGKYLFEFVPYRHRYPACWRCKSELVWRVVDEWYVAMGKPLQKSKIKNQKSKSLREELKSIAKRINWIPKFGLKRELDWLENMHDWLISKKRYWGLALPIWECSPPAGGCGSFEVIGSKEELEKRAVAGWDKFRGHTPHRPWVDEVKIRCEKCSKLMLRISDVGNPWLDAGIVPFSTISKDNKGKPLYQEDKKEWFEWFPADFITESFPGQFKNWFYSLLVMSTVLAGKEPFKTVLGFATLLGEDGRPMHKSLGNSIEFNQAADKIGVDIMRWLYTKQDPVQNLLFGYKGADETRRRFFLILWNSYKFFVTYANLSGWNCKKTPVDINGELTVLDCWVLAKLTQVTKKVNKSLHRYNAASATAAIEEFVVEDLSTWYLRRSRSRAGPGSGKDETVFLSVLYGVLVTISKLLAPFMPYVADEIYKNLSGEESVHLSDYPQGERVLLDEKLIQEMEAVRKVASSAHSQRKQAGIPLRQPLTSITVNYVRPKPEKDVLYLLKEELNVKKVNWTVKKSSKRPDVVLDTRLTSNLLEEGKTRELARSIQEARKNLDVALDDKVVVFSPWFPKNKKLLNWLKGKVLASRFEKGDTLKVEK